MMIRGTTRLIAILGNPLAHSFSPAMHNHAVQSLDLDLVYLPLPVQTLNLATLLMALKSVNFIGANVTLPHKQSVISHLDELSDISKKMGAVNTIVNREGQLFGTTTDPEGFLRAFHDAGHSFKEKSVVILGNGGAARTIAFALCLMADPKQVTIVARDMKKSTGLATEIADKTRSVLEILPLEKYAEHAEKFDIVVNTTPLGMHPNLEASPLRAEWLHSRQIVYDIIYNPESTRLMRDAIARGCVVVGGLGMLVHQGVASFKLWTGTDPDPELFYAGIRKQQAADAVQKLGLCS